MLVQRGTLGHLALCFAMTVPATSCTPAAPRKAPTSEPVVVPPPVVDAGADDGAPPALAPAGWQQLIDEERIWIRADMESHCSDPTTAYFLPEATGPEHPQWQIAVAGGCTKIDAGTVTSEGDGGRVWHGVAMCCPRSLPPAAAPHTGGGKSCEQVVAEYEGVPDAGSSISAGQYGAVLNRGSYFAPCGVPDTTRLYICAGVQNGRVTGVTVRTEPRSPEIADCVARAVRGLTFPARPTLDVTRTTFE